MKSLFPCFALSATLLGVAHPAAAQSFDAVQLRNAPPGADGGSVGLVVVSTPEYLGGDQRKTLVFPNVSYQWANGWFAGLDNGVGYNFSKNPALHYGLRLTADTTGFTQAIHTADASLQKLHTQAGTTAQSAQGLGQAMLEACVYDEESGQLLTGSYQDYTMPRADDLPNFTVDHTVTPCTSWLW